MQYVVQNIMTFEYKALSNNQKVIKIICGEYYEYCFMNIMKGKCKNQIK